MENDVFVWTVRDIGLLVYLGILMLIGLSFAFLHLVNKLKKWLKKR